MDLKSYIRVIPDFPEQGISFKDITTLLSDGTAFKYVIDEFCQMAQGLNVHTIIGPEARGFILGTAVAYGLESGFVPARKPGKLPFDTITEGYSLEYGKNSLEIHVDSIKPGQNVLIVDDLLATGGTLKTTAKLIEKLKGNVVGIFTLIELTDLRGRDQLEGYHVKSLIKYPY